MSASSSIARWAAAVSVVTNGLPVPAARMTMPPLFQMPAGAAADVGLGDAVHVDGGHHARFAAERFQGVLQGQGVDDGGQHAHVVGGGFLNAGVACL